ncbi:acyl-CoA desaturase [Thioalkalivibrio sp. HK1]|uniref:acyl-CoA desaturase n=1 Tax=Thioalkalivibrio sp. HK1 TaxID=1469245 RepID=UPI0009DE25DB|nr:acyl-CoA desaturase [Thioalkalivibrio sp. HK1]
MSDRIPEDEGGLAENEPSAATPKPSPWRRALRWLINDPAAFEPAAGSRAPAEEGSNGACANRVDPLRASFFVALHLVCLLVVVVGVSKAALVLCAILYFLRMFFITGFYHRYFSHRAFRAGRWMTWTMAALGCTAGQRGPLWWAGHHRIHHRFSDTPDDPHSPRHRGRWFSHCLWFLSPRSFAVPTEHVRDWMRFRELRILERIDSVPFILLGVACALLGAWLDRAYPALETGAGQMFVWFSISTVLVYHATYTINSLAHGFGSRRYDTPDDSRNNAWLALITLGEGWHNNHHRYPISARQGFRRWEIDLTWLGLRALAAVGLISDLRPVPDRLLRNADASDHRPPEPASPAGSSSSIGDVSGDTSGDISAPGEQSLEKRRGSRRCECASR